MTDGRKKILLIRLKSIGDIVFTLPAVHAVRDNFPDARISFLVSKEHAPMIEGFGDVNEIIALDRAAFRGPSPFALLREVGALRRRLRRETFSRVLDFQGYGETALLTWLTRAPERWGIVYQSARAWAYTRGIRRDWSIHPAEWNLQMLAQCGLKTQHVRNEFAVPAAALNTARNFFLTHGLKPDQATLFLQPFTSSPHKNWPLENYLTVAARQKSQGTQVLFGGGPADAAALEPARRAGFPVSAGAPLPVTAGLMKLSTAVVGGDTGVLHLAVALNQRVVMLAGPGATPLFRRSDGVLIADKTEGLNSLKIDTVVRAIDSALRPGSEV